MSMNPIGWLTSLVGGKRTSAQRAKQRLMTVLTHERSARGLPEYLPILQRELQLVVPSTCRWRRAKSACASAIRATRRRASKCASSCRRSRTASNLQHVATALPAMPGHFARPMRRPTSL